MAEDAYESLRPFNILDVAKQNCDSILNVLIKNIHIYDFGINSVDDDGNTLLHIAVLQGNEDLARRSIKMGANVDMVNQKGQSALHLACEKGDVSVVRMLMKAGAQIYMVNLEGEGPVFGAVRSGNLETVKCFRDYNVVSRTGDTLLHIAAVSPKITSSVFDILLHSGCKVNQENFSGTTPLQLAVQEGNIAAYDMLTKNGANVQTKDFRNRSILHLTVRSNGESVVKRLTSSGVDLNSRDFEGCTPLHRAIELGLLEIAVWLIDRGSDVNAIDNDGYTCLHLAAETSQFNLMQILLAKGADIEAVTFNGDTCVHRAAAVGSKCSLEYLKKYGASLGRKNRDKCTPLDLAKQCGHLSAIEYLNECLKGNSVVYRRSRGVARVINNSTSRMSEPPSFFSKIPIPRSKSVSRLVAEVEIVKKTESTRIPVHRSRSSRRSLCVLPCDRNVKDVELISVRLRRVEQLCRLPNSVLQQLALCGYYEDLEKGVTLFRQGDTGKCWYAVLTGTLDVRINQTDVDTKVPVTLCSLGVGATFGESILHDLPRDTTVVTQTTCELLRVEQHDFKLIWEKNKELMNDLVANCKLKNGLGSSVNSKGNSMQQSSVSPPPRRSMSPDQPNPAEPITESPSTTMGRIGWALRTLLLSQNTCLKDRKVSGRLVRRCAPGTELVDWLLALSPSVHNRVQAAGMWQALLEEGVIAHVSREQPFKDKCFLYRFWQDEEGATALPTLEDVATAEDQIQEYLVKLIHRGPDAVMRMILRKQSHERTQDDLDIIYEELLHIRALSHLSNSIKRELASVIFFEAHPRAGTVLFHQGDEGRSWYIILRGSVDVVIHGKGTVTTLQECDDFGKLALINDAPRAATIVLRENNCHFLRVDKENFNRILRDVEANTVRLKEHGKDVLVLEKISTQQKQLFSHFKYTVMAGTPQKMLEHLLETRLDGRNNINGDKLITLGQDPFLDDFLLTHIVFLPTHQLVSELDRQIDSSNQDRDFVLACKRRVIQFVYRWVTTIRQPVFEDESAVEFIEDLAAELENDSTHWSALQEEASLMHHVLSQLRRYQEDRKAHEGQKWKLPPCGQPISLFSGNDTSRTIIMPQDDIIFRVYCADHTYCTLRLPVDSTAETIKVFAADKLKMRQTDELVLVEVKSNGERVLFKDDDISIPTALSLNGRIFVSPKDHQDALTCLSEQEEATQGIEADIEMFSTKELAYYMTLFDWDLFWCVHEYELIYHTFGRHHFGQITANLDVFVRRFNEIQFWVVTEICHCVSLSKRVAILRKFIKLAAYCKEYQNLNAFCAIVMGLSNVAVSRLSLTWEKLPSKFRKLYTEFESLIDPSRNHRAYRVSVGKLQPPVVPFMPLLLKDMTFTHEGNKTCLDGLVNFEKMHMLAQTMRTIRFCRSRHLVLEPPSPKSEGEVKSYISCLRVIDNQRVLTSMSQKLEPRRP